MALRNKLLLVHLLLNKTEPWNYSKNKVRTQEISCFWMPNNLCFQIQNSTFSTVYMKVDEIWKLYLIHWLVNCIVSLSPWNSFYLDGPISLLDVIKGNVWHSGISSPVYWGTERGLRKRNLLRNHIYRIVMLHQLWRKQVEKKFANSWCFLNRITVVGQSLLSGILP